MNIAEEREKAGSRYFLISVKTSMVSTKNEHNSQDEIEYTINTNA